MSSSSTPLTVRLIAANGSFAAALLRDQLAALLRTTGHETLVDSARLCMSEVVTNVYRHTRTRLVYVRAAVTEKSVTVFVRDDLPCSLSTPGAVDLCEGGRGLFLLDSLTDSWGTRIYGTPAPSGKDVWFQFVAGGRGVC
ncbi:ATP-binding protein [Streptomyces sp. V2]|uniref:ATP-binding protein n=1 Tax=Streptomyces TaxID=1883 RepID=UPI0006EB75C2|nr:MULTISPECIES: ATP-binding protein [Streptomyces]PWG10588.1 ATP-binding protein [Streptomyces sp. V2]